ncbi:hypothetical protein [Photorhabdus luminescens]|uniref:hypothetical protein n=2 Tax=Photorhabdus akhurstii TaxID=171438 RepID=UPI0011B7648A
MVSQSFTIVVLKEVSMLAQLPHTAIQLETDVKRKKSPRKTAAFDVKRAAEQGDKNFQYFLKSGKLPVSR